MKTLLEKKIKYNFKNKAKLNVFISGMYSPEKAFIFNDYATLALKGDAVLRISVLNMLESLSITKLSRTEQHYLTQYLTTNKTLSTVFIKKDFESCFTGKLVASEFSTYLESIIGLVYEDSNNNYKATEKVIINIYSDILFFLFAEIIKIHTDSHRNHQSNEKSSSF